MATRMKEKAQRVEELREKRPHATAKHVRIAPDKVRIVLALIRGRSVSEAMAILQATPKAASEQVFKVLNSAAANAEHNNGLSVDDLYVAEAYADVGPTLKRYQPVSKGRAHHILKRTSHITVILDTKEDK
ncbi:MAG: 50S ribosomal protein L22 [Clostridiales bacterium]|nr:50S ribosomal protein L22 [Clostridiales bacterium]MDE7108073.1 50S ribosomal protein L22 [Clostridiales bacterium]MDE7405616.1 50S ribosomal protein L22 [Clostridiales bacterium]